MDTETREAMENAIWLAATNNGKAYAKRDAKAAINEGFAEYQRTMREQEREEYREIRWSLLGALTDRWDDRSGLQGSGSTVTRRNKYLYLYVVQGHYGFGWEDVAAGTRAEARTNLREYRENDPDHAYRMVHRRELNADE